MVFFQTVDCFYLSPWDRNKPCYGSGKEYDDYYLAQLTISNLGTNAGVMVQMDNVQKSGGNISILGLLENALVF